MGTVRYLCFVGFVATMLRFEDFAYYEYNQSLSDMSTMMTSRKNPLLSKNDFFGGDSYLNALFLNNVGGRKVLSEINRDDDCHIVLLSAIELVQHTIIKYSSVCTVLEYGQYLEMERNVYIHANPRYILRNAASNIKESIAARKQPSNPY